MEFPRAAPSGIPQTSLGFRGHLITNFPHIMVLLIINVEISLKTKTRLRGHGPSWPLSLVFVFKLISTFIGQNPKLFFMHVLKKDILLL